MPTNAIDSEGDYATTFEYTYDAVGNRTTQTATITCTRVTNYVYDPANRLTTAGADSIVFQPLNGDPDCLDEYIRYLMPVLK